MVLKHLLKHCVIMVLLLSISGCSSFLTSRSPLYSKLKNGKTSVGEVSSYKYSGSLHENVGYLERTPMCAEIIEKVRVAQKQRRGRVFAWAEMLFFGLGLYDAASAYAIIDDSKKVEPLAAFESSNLVACGEKEPAANEKIVIFVRPEITDGVKPENYYRTASTDENGKIDFNRVFSDENRTLNLTARLASDDSRAVSFFYNPKYRRQANP